METALIIALLFSCVLVVFAWRVLNWVWFNPKRLEKCFKKQGFKGNPYKLFYGDIKEITTMFEEANSKPINLSDNVVPRIIPHLLGAVKKYGKKTYVWYGPEPTVLVMDPELIREVTQKWEVFQKPHSLPYVKLLAQGILFFEGDRWVKQRKLLKPAFHMEKLKLMLPAFEKSASDMLNKWEKIVPLTGSIELNVWPHLETMTSDAISRTAFGSRYEDGRRVFELQSEQGRHFAESLRSMYFPGLRFLPTKRNRRMKQIAKEVDGLIKGLINARQKGLRTGEATDDDLLGILLESNSQEIDEKLRMTTREMIDECKLFYIAGLETTSSLLVWTLVLLSIHADWQSRAREEVLQRFGTNIPNFDGLNHLKVVTMILHEVLRLYPPFPVLERDTAEETKLGNLTLQSGEHMIMPIMLLHHDPEIWGKDVEEFKPERFAEGVSNVTRGRVVYFPFGWGPRICIGQNLCWKQNWLYL